MSEVLKPRPRIDLIPVQNRVSKQELVDHPEKVGHYEFLITGSGIHLEHNGGLGCTINFNDDSVGIKGKLVRSGMEVRSLLAPGSHLSLSHVIDPEIGYIPIEPIDERPPLKFSGRFTLVIRND